MSAVDKEGMIEYPFSYQTVFRAAVQSIPLIKGMMLGKTDEINGYILITGNISWTSWGENIRVDFVKLGPTRTQMIVKSGATVSTTLVDWGKNKKNVNKILSAVSTTLANYPPETAYNDAAQPVQETNPQFGQMPPQPPQPQQAYQQPPQPQQTYEQPPQPPQAHQQPPQPQQTYQQPPQPPQPPQAYQQPQQPPQAYQQPPQPQQTYQQPPQPPQAYQQPQQAYQQPQQAYQQPPQPQQAYQQAQQQGYQQPKPPMRPENNMLWGVLCTVFCCLPLGIIAIVFSNKVNSLYDFGDYSGAQEAADNAKKYAVLGAICGFVFIGIAFIAFVLTNL